MLQNIRIVLVETSHTGNMGSVARAMKTMGLTNLWLVNPLVKPDSQAIALAAGASDVIGNAHIVDTLDEALAGCSLVVGTSARSRTLPWPMLDPRECGLKSVAEAANTPVALVFGRERVGLTNEELQKCHYHVAIAANPEHSSLNLAMAVQVIAYEVRMAWLTASSLPTKVEKLESTAMLNAQAATADELESFYGHLRRVLVMIGFLDPQKPRHLMTRLRRLYGRSAVSKLEMNILRGILTETQKAVRGESHKRSKDDV